MKNYLLVITAVLGFLGVLAGALGAHALKKVLQPETLESFHTAVRYQIYHVLATLLVSALPVQPSIKNVTGILFLIGILFFSGSIYLIAAGVSAKNIWFITPLGGLFFMAGWLVLAYGLYRGI